MLLKLLFAVSWAECTSENLSRVVLVVYEAEVKYGNIKASDGYRRGYVSFAHFLFLLNFLTRFPKVFER